MNKRGGIMTENELSRYFKLKKEVEDIERRIKELGVGVASIKIKEISVNGTTAKESIQEKIAILNDTYLEKRLSALEEYVKIERYIGSIDDPEIRILMRYRFLDLYTWEQIAEKTYQERTTVAKKIRRFLKSENSHNSHWVYGNMILW